MWFSSNLNSQGREVLLLLLLLLLFSFRFGVDCYSPKI